MMFWNGADKWKTHNIKMVQLPKREGHLWKASAFDQLINFTEKQPFFYPMIVCALLHLCGKKKPKIKKCPFQRETDTQET